MVGVMSKIKPLVRNSIGLLTWAALLLFTATAHSAGSVDQLKKQYDKAIREAKTLVADPARITGFERFQLAYSSIPAENFDQRIGRLLLVLETQDAVVEAYLAKKSHSELQSLQPPKNGLVYDLGVGLARKLMLLDAPNDSDKNKEYRKALKDFFEIFDLRDMNGGFSGLPFYSTVEQRFNDSEFRARVIEFEKKLNAQLEHFAKQPGQALTSNIFDLALEVTGGQKKPAIELVAILTSRDVLITRYLKHFKTHDQKFVRTFSRSPVLIRLLAELDQKARGSELDRFSFPATLKLTDERSYYYWSSAYTTLRLKEIGYSDEVVERINKSFPKQYKTLRYLEGMGPFKSKAFKKDFAQRTRETIEIANEGIQLALQQSDETMLKKTGTTVEYQKFDRFIKNLKEEKNFKTLQKAQMLEEIAADAQTSRENAYLLYYNYESNVIGYPHLKLILNGEVYEIHRTPNADGTFLRQRSLTAALKDARQGYLPSGILALPMSPEQMALAVRELQIISDGSMKYAFFNKLFNSKTFNCGGVLYEALLLAGFDLPQLGRLQVLPGQMFRSVYRSVKGARFVGVGKKW